MLDPGLELQACKAKDVDEVRQFVAACAPLELHTAFTYWVTFEQWGDLCFVIRHDERIVGYISAIGSSRHRGAIYVWQIGVANELRRQGLAQHLLSAVVETAIEKGYETAQISIARDNEASRRAFERFAVDEGLKLAVGEEMSLEDTLSGALIQETCFELSLTPRPT